VRNTPSVLVCHKPCSILSLYQVGDWVHNSLLYNVLTQVYHYNSRSLKLA